MMRFNRPGGFVLGPRSFGAHYDLCSTQRRIGKHVYIFRRVASGIKVWRLELSGGHRWTLVHSFNAALDAESEAIAYVEAARDVDPNGHRAAIFTDLMFDESEGSL